MPLAAGRPWIAAVFAVLVGLEPALGADNAGNAAQGLSDADQLCIGCHATEGLSTKLANGDVLSLVIDGAAFAASVHQPLGCAACHPQAATPEHPGNVKSAESARQYALAQSQTCRACHDGVFEAYERSVHALRAHEGNTAAPVCADCHPPHAVLRASALGGPKETCLACHGDAVKQHGLWLPNPENHLRAVTCSACHAPGAQPHVDLQLQQGTVRWSMPATRSGSSGAPAPPTPTPTASTRYELRALLADLGQGGGKVSLRGRIELLSGVAAHELPGKSQAIRDCAKCHDAGAAPFQKVTVSVLDAKGSPVRYAAHREILNSVTTWDALKGFYAFGGTRFRLLDIVLGVCLVGGLAVPALHLAIRRLSRREPPTDGGQK